MALLVKGLLICAAASFTAGFTILFKFGRAIHKNHPIHLSQFMKTLFLSSVAFFVFATSIGGTVPIVQNAGAPVTIKQLLTIMLAAATFTILAHCIVVFETIFIYRSYFSIWYKEAKEIINNV